MAATANSLRHCLRTCSRPPPPSLRTAAAPLRQRRALSTTPPRRREEREEPEETLGIPTYAEGIEHLLKRKELQPGDRPMLERLLKELQDNPDKAEFYERKYRARRDWSRVPYHEGLAPLSRPVKPKAKRASFWNKNEPDPDLVTAEIGEDEWEEDDMLSIAHDKLEEHREYRQYARITVWEMPLLAKFAKEFRPPTQEEVLRFRYTTYMGEFHPADRKVVVEFCPKDLTDLTDLQRMKLKKLAGARYNPEKDIVKMSCERFEHQAQNKRYLGDTVQKLIEAAKDPSDTFEDVPLDTRHHRFKPKPKFPVEWRMTDGRKAELEALRKQVYDARGLPIPAVRGENMSKAAAGEGKQAEVRPELIPEHVHVGHDKRL